MSRTVVLASIICLLIVLAGPATSVKGASPSLAGSWQLTFVPFTPPIPAIPIAGLATFISEGTVIETDASQVVPVPTPAGDATIYGTAAHGIWQLSPAVPYLFVQFISVVANANGSLYGKTTTTMTIGLNAAGTQLRGSYTSQLADPSGNVLRTTTGTVTGQLIPHPKLP